MSGFGTDFISLACILGGAATGGAMTMALMDGGEDARVDCSVEAISLGSQVVVSGDTGARAIVLSTPHLTLHQAHDCQMAAAGEVRVQIGEARREMVEARYRMERREREMREARKTVLTIWEGEAQPAEAEAIEADTGARLEAMEILLEKVEKVEKRSGGADGLGNGSSARS